MSTSPLAIGALLFEQMDQLDFTGPFEVLSRVPHSTFWTLGKTLAPVRDARGLILTPERTISEAPQLDVLVVPGGTGVNALMEDDEVLRFLRQQASGVKILFSVCTGALLCGAAGLLRGRKATTHWASHHLLEKFGARPVNDRVVMDGNLVSASGVTSGIDGALLVAALLRGDLTAQGIQLYLEYAPTPPFACGSPGSAPADVVTAVLAEMSASISEREIIADRVGSRLNR